MFGFGLTRFLPGWIRTRLLSIVQICRHGSTDIRFSPVNPRLFRGDRVVIAGMFSIQCGLQRAAELMALSFEAQGVPVLRFDLAGLLRLDRGKPGNSTDSLSKLRTFGGTDIIVHAPPPMFERFLAKWGGRSYRRSNLIAYWHWELAAAPLSWGTALRYCDEIWVPTPFVREAILTSFPNAQRRLRIVRNATEMDPFPRTMRADQLKSREEHGIPPDAFVCGFTFSAASGFERKNPLGAVKAFQAAFYTDELVRLVIRCHDSEKYLSGWRKLVLAATEDPRIILMDGAGLRVSIRDFYVMLDVLLTLHRSEGFGLTIAEAAQCGASVVTTDWGLAPELEALEQVHTIASRMIPVNDGQGLYANYITQSWAEPDYAAAAKKLRDLYVAGNL